MYFIILSFFFMMFTIFMMIMFMLVLIEEKIYIFEYNIMYFDFLMEIKMFFYIDFLSNLFLFVVSLITASTFFYSMYYMDKDKMKNKFLLLTMLFVICMFLVVLGMNFFIILVGWDGLGVVSYFLVIHYNSDNSYYSGLITIMINRLGDIGMIFSLFILMEYNCLDIILLNWQEKLNYLAFIFLCLASFTKSAQFPFSSWLPLAMAAPTPISALVHSSTLVTAGVYLLVRFDCLFNNSSKILINSFCMVGVTIMISGLSAFVEFDIKKIIAFSTLSQLGLMMMILLLGQDILSFFHILTHALFKALLFLCSGVFIHECMDNQDIRCYSQVMKNNLFMISIFMICSLSLAGFPFLSGFYSKDLILEFFYSLNYNLMYLILLIFMTMMTSAYSLRLLIYSLLITKNSMKLIYSVNWNYMYNSFMLIYLGVLFSGSMMFWILLEKFSFMYFKLYVKLFNLTYIIGGLFLFFNLKLNYFLIEFFLKMFYLTSYQGFIFNKFFESSIYFFCHSEYYIENFSFYSINKVLLKLSLFVSFFKFIYFMFIFIFILNFMLLY